MAPPHPRRSRGAAGHPDRHSPRRRPACPDRLRLRDGLSVRRLCRPADRGSLRTQAVWRWLAEAITDIDNRNNRFEVATRINATFPEGPGPFWSHPSGPKLARLALPSRRASTTSPLGLSETRAAEAAVPRAKSPWMLFNPGSVGSQSLLGLPMIHRLSQLPDVAVWPFADPRRTRCAGRGLPLAPCRSRRHPGECRGRADRRPGPGPPSCPAPFSSLARARPAWPPCSTCHPRPPKKAGSSAPDHAPLLAEALTWA